MVTRITSSQDVSRPGWHRSDLADFGPPEPAVPYSFHARTEFAATASIAAAADSSASSPSGPPTS